MLPSLVIKVSNLVLMYDPLVVEAQTRKMHFWQQKKTYPIKNHFSLSLWPTQKGY